MFESQTATWGSSKCKNLVFRRYLGKMFDFGQYRNDAYTFLYKNCNFQLYGKIFTVPIVQLHQGFRVVREIKFCTTPKYDEGGAR